MSMKNMQTTVDLSVCLKCNIDYHAETDVAYMLLEYTSNATLAMEQEIVVWIDDMHCVAV